MDDWRKNCTTASASSTGNAPTLAGLAALVERFKPPLRREFIYEGKVHAIAQGGRITASAEWYAKIRAACPTAAISQVLPGNPMPFTGYEIVIDDSLPREPTMSPANLLTRCSVYGGS